MALINCPECGKEISDKAVACPSCGYPLLKTENQPFQQPYQQLPYQQPVYLYCKPKIPGRGFGITSLIMGILGVLYAFGVLENILKTKTSVIILPLVVIYSILALIFGGVSYSRGYKKGQCIAGLVLGVVSLVICIVDFIIYIRL